MADWEYKGIYKEYDMDGIIDLPYGSKVKACDWLLEMPEFMKEADTLFIDPPWNKGNANSFYTKANKKHVVFDFVKFSKSLLSRIDEVSPKTLFIEMGKEYLSWYIEECKRRYKYITFYNSMYYKKKGNKCYVIHATNNHATRRYRELEDLDESEIIGWICTNHQYHCIGDLCMGRGLVGKYAFLNNKKFVGIELNKKRLAILVDFIRNNN